MKKIKTPVIPFFIFFALASCSTEMHESTWQTKKVVVDGNPTEWSLPLRYSDPNSGLQYNITNDETNLYFCLRATERPVQMKVLSSGIVLWLDPAGKNKKTVGIHFPLPVRIEGRPPQEEVKTDNSRSANPGRMSLQKEFELQKPEITLSGFLPGYDGTFEADDAKGAKAAINWDDQDNMTYELAIPFKSFLAEDFSKSRDNPVIGFTIDIAAVSRPQGSGSHEGGTHGGGGGGQHQGNWGGGQGGMEGGHGGMEGGGHGGGHGGGMGESHQSGGGKAYSSMSEPTSIKFKVKLTGLVKK